MKEKERTREQLIAELDACRVQLADLRRSEERYWRLVENLRTEYFFYSHDRDDVFTYVSPSIYNVLGYTPGEFQRNYIRYLTDNPINQSMNDYINAAGADDKQRSCELEFRHRDGSGHRLEITETPVRGPDGKVESVEGIAHDITERRRVEEQYRHAQKMEAVGRLAGGIAHDFNNILSVINGCTEMILTTVPETDPIRSDLKEILEAGNRAAVLTRQLLAFSRKQVLEPKVMDLNTVVDTIKKMLGRVIGEDIELVIVPGQDLSRVKIDPGQIEQVIVNLAVNARDAMPAGGILTLETRNVELDDEYARVHPEVEPGLYAMLVISDTGGGMDQETLNRIFEPFFTTKERDKGTGLGLAMVYGIVKQSSGHVSVYSELGKGTTFRIYLPQVSDEISAPAQLRRTDPLLRGTETVLLVEDNVAVRRLSERVLVEAGYTVLTAANGGEALLLCEQRHPPINLLLTDVVMPVMNGPALAQRLILIHPVLKVIYISGYTDNAIVHHGVLDQGVHFLAKPFSIADLLRKIRIVLDGDGTP